MGKRLRSQLLTIFNKLLAKVNLKLQRTNGLAGNQILDKERYIWSKLSLLPSVPTIIDVGIGPGGTPALYQRFPNVNYIFIDPLEECRLAVEAMLKGGENRFMAYALGSSNGSAFINIALKPSRSSFYERTHSRKSAAVSRREVPVRKLDDLMQDLMMPTPYGIKIDTEGYELEVIKGAKETLKKTRFVIAEFHFKDGAKNGYTLQDVINHMQDAGFFAYYMLRDGRNLVFLNRSFLNKC